MRRFLPSFGQTSLQRSARLALAWIILVYLALMPGEVLGQAETPGESKRYVAGEIVLAWRPESGAVPVVPYASGSQPGRASLESLQAAASLVELTGLPVLDARAEYGFARLAVTPGSELAEIARLRQLPWVAYAEPNHILRAATDARYPTDPNFGLQWYARRVAAPGAWAVTQGNTSIVVAVVDSGLDLAHPEFPAWRIVSGWDYVNGDAVPEDQNGHGTHVAGILAATTDNGQGISGLAPYVQIRSLKVLGADGTGDQAAVALAIYDAVNGAYGASPAKIINLSLGAIFDLTTPPLTLQGAVNYARDNDVLVVAAAGNCAQGSTLRECEYLTNPAFYPAAYDGVLAVAASDHYDNWAPYSGYKPYIGIAAPGGIQNDAIWSTLPGGYGFAYGTSMATPLVSGAAALVWTVQPSGNGQDVASILKSTADKVGTNPFTGQPIPYVNGRNDYFGYGRLNVMRAVRWAYPPSLQPITTKQTFLLGGPLVQSARTLPLINPSDQAITWEATVTSGADWLSVTPAVGNVSYTMPAGLTLQAGPTALGPGLYTGAIRVQPLYPGWLYGFDIPVELWVSESVGQVFLPVIFRDRYGPDWYDPFASVSTPPSVISIPNEGLVTQALPFPVTFFGGVYSQIRVSENGLATLGLGEGTILPVPTSCLPSAAAPNNAVYVLAADWQLALGGEVYAHQPDPDTYVITWHQVRRAVGAPPNSFQLAFHRSGVITAHYQVVDPLLNPIVGTENFDGTYAQQVVCDGLGRGVGSGDVLALETILPW